MKKWLFILLLILVAAFGFTQRVLIKDWWTAQIAPEVPSAVSFDEIVPAAPEPEPESEPELRSSEPDPVVSEPEGPIQENGPEKIDTGSSNPPFAFNLAVPFTPQAPYAVWDAAHEEACEEASVFMVHRFYEGDPAGLISAKEAEDEIQKLIAFQQTLFGFFEDTNVEQTAVFAEQFYGYSRVEIERDPTVDRIKEHVAAGRPVIVPAAGRLLGNPYFSGEGPDYHMLVIRGYTEEAFITNDPGTKRGEGYTYPIETLMNAVHDWKPSDVENGQKVIIVMYPEAG